MKTSNKILLGALILGLLSIAAFFFAAQFYINDDVLVGSGGIVTETRNPGSCTGIKSGKGVSVHLTQGPAIKVEVKTYQNMLPEVETRVENGMLVIHAKKRISISDHNHRIEVFVTMPEVKALDLSSGSYLKSTGKISGEALSLDCSSGGSLHISLHYREIKCDVGSGARVELEGDAETAEISCSSGSGLHAEKLLLKICSISASSGAELSLTVSDELSGDVSSGAAVKYIGSPDVKNLSVSSGGSFRKR